MAPTRHRRRVLRAVLYAVLGLVSLVVWAAAIALVAVHTDWGREKLRARLEASLDGLFDPSFTQDYIDRQGG